MNIIELNNVTPAAFADISRIASEVWQSSLAFEKGKKYLVSAQSGGGKSSLCAFLFGYRADYSGDIFFDKRNLRDFSVNDWCLVRQRQIAYLPQDLRLFGELTAWENISIKNEITSFRNDSEILEMFRKLGIEDMIGKPVGKLSIGQQQRVAIIRALCQPCDFIMLDEPVSHLDEDNNTVIADLVYDFAEKAGAGIIATSVGNNLNMDYDIVLKL